jgi:murein DD-endopeptidase MepM/ murein hydrolase activator NlpD
MIYPLKNWEKLKRGYTFGVPTFYNNFHLGLDIIIPVGIPIYAWQDLKITSVSVGSQGGNTAFVKCNNNPRLFRLLHLREKPKIGNYKEGQIIAYSGKTGIGTGAHLHIDISKNGLLELNNHDNFEDPEKYFKSLMIKQFMTNAKIVQKEGSKEVGIYLPVLSEAALLSIGANFGIEIPATPQGGVDWTKLKKDGTVKY